MTRMFGGCLCGAVRYETHNAPLNMRVCHCTLCQKAIGAAFNARALFRIEDVSISGDVATFPSSEDLVRGFCPRCGATVFSRPSSASIMGLTAGSLDDPSAFAPDMHFWTASKQLWVKLDDGLPQYPEAPPPA